MSPRQPNAVPARLAALPLRTVTARAAADTYTHPGVDLARMARRGVLHKTARGYYVVVPAEHVGSTWLPSLEAVAAGIGAAIFGPTDAVLMGLSAARLHGVVPRALAASVVAVPRQRAQIHLIDRPATIAFVKREVGRLDVESMLTDLGRAAVTTPEQTVLDLGRGLGHLNAGTEARDAAVRLLDRCDETTLARLAGQQNMRSTLARVQSWRE